MSAPVTTATHFQWPADVLEFAARHSLRPCLDPLLEATRRVFPTTQSVEVSLAYDPEVSEDWNIDFEVQVPAPDVPDFVAAIHRWNREMYRCSPGPQLCIFRLRLFLVSP
jgi:hypothetical protein